MEEILDGNAGEECADSEEEEEEIAAAFGAGSGTLASIALPIIVLVFGAGPMHFLWVRRAIHRLLWAELPNRRHFLIYAPTMHHRPKLVHFSPPERCFLCINSAVNVVENDSAFPNGVNCII